jgi:predicted aspartyl protease
MRQAFRFVLPVILTGAAMATLVAIPAFFAAMLAFAQPAAATCTVGKLTTLPVTLQHGKVYVPVTINDTAGLFLLDTGSGETLVNKPFAAEAGLGMDRHAGEYVYTGAGNEDTLPVFKGHARMTHVGDVHFQDWEYGIVDLGGVAPDGKPMGGLLGMDFLHYFDLELDFVTRQATLYRLTGCTDMHPPAWTGDYDAIPLRHTPNHNLTLPVFLDNALLDMEFDTGASGVLVTRAAAAKAGVTDSILAHDAAAEGNGVGGRFTMVRHHFDLLLIGGGVYPNVELPVENAQSRRGETDGLVGLAAFKAQRVWISFATNTLFVQGAPKLKTK